MEGGPFRLPEYSREVYILRSTSYRLAARVSINTSPISCVRGGLDGLDYIRGSLHSRMTVRRPMEYGFIRVLIVMA
jgi:hypothetical protein